MKRDWKLAMWLGGVVLVSACTRDLSVPPAPGPGSLSGTLMYAVPGKTSLQPAAGARAFIVNSSVEATANAEGTFRLDRVTVTSGVLWLAADVDGDGQADRQRRIDLATLALRAGADVSLGTLTLGRNAAIVGKALRGDVTTPGGHGGSTVFVPEGPFAATTADDGSFSLPELPEGPVTVAVFRGGYDAVSASADVRGGEELRLRDFVLERQTTPPLTASLTGRVRLEPEATDGASTEVTLYRAGAVVSVAQASATGEYSFAGATEGLFDLGVVRPGYGSVLVRNLLLTGGANVASDIVLSTGTSTPLDAGVLVPPVDGGGGADGGGTDGGGTVDGGADAGADAGTIDPGPPVAIIDPAVLAVAWDGGVVRLDAARSTGLQPLTFAWAVTQGIQIPLSSPSPYASYVDFTQPAGPTTLTLEVTVRDPMLRSSRATAQVLVAETPSARIQASSTVLTPSVTLSAALSVDPLGLPLTYAWTLVGGSATLSTTSGVSTTVTAMPGAFGLLRVQLVATNSFGLASAPAFVDLTALGNFFEADAGPSQTVNEGTLVILSGSAASSNSGDTFSYQWREPGAPQPPLVINNSTQPTANFFAGAAGTRQLELEVRRPANCTGAPPQCETRMSQTQVTVLDITAPTPIFPNQLEASRYAPLVVGFNEPLAPASVSTSSVVLRHLGSMTAVPISVSPGLGQQIVITLQQALNTGASYRIELAGITDASPQANAVSANSNAFTAREAFVTSPTVYPNDSVDYVPRPGAAVITPFVMGMPQPSQQFVASDRGNGGSSIAWSFNPFDPYTTGVVEQSPTTPLLAPTDLGRRLHVANGRVFAQVGTAWGGGWATGTDGLMLMHTGATWTPLTRRTGGTGRYASPGRVFSDGANLYAIIADSAVKLSRLDTTGIVSTWGFPDAASSEVVSATMEVGAGPGLVADGTAQKDVRYVAALQSFFVPTRIVAYKSVAFGPWTQMHDSPLSFGTGTFTPQDLRLAVTDDYTALLAVTGTDSASPSLRLFSRPSALTWAAASAPATTGVTSASLVTVGRIAWLALVLNGELRLYQSGVDTLGALAWSQVPGPTLPNQTFNNQSGCTAANVELSLFNNQPLLVWTETCDIVGAIKWKIYSRRVE